MFQSDNFLYVFNNVSPVMLICAFKHWWHRYTIIVYLIIQIGKAAVQYKATYWKKENQEENQTHIIWLVWTDYWQYFTVSAICINNLGYKPKH